jgi:hypothetical protein
MALTLSLIVMVARGPEAIIVPFERAPSPYIIIRVPVAGGPCESLIFDTGTTTTVLTPALAARVGLSAGTATSVESLTESKGAIQGEVRGIGFPGIPATGPRMAIATSMKGLSQFGSHVAGLYGHNWLTRTDYLIDYDAQHLVLASAGRLPPPSGGLPVPLTWSGGLPVITAKVDPQPIESFPARFVLDSGADHLTLFGRAADRLKQTDNRGTMSIDSGFGVREVPSAEVRVDVGGRHLRVAAEIRSDERNRGEDGLIPTALFHSVFVSDAVVVFDGRVSGWNERERMPACDHPAGRPGTKRQP